MRTARELFDQMPRRNLVTWNAMIAGYAKIGEMGVALWLTSTIHPQGPIELKETECHSTSRKDKESIERLTQKEIPILHRRNPTESNQKNKEPYESVLEKHSVRASQPSGTDKAIRN
ncbi:hypothetical protein EJ110_NYTH34052 [Nymphaea thermarum]|nr:hypothetical protein EJ110_NYTH34052 [Nymphaea thermarum]